MILHIYNTDYVVSAFSSYTGSLVNLSSLNMEIKIIISRINMDKRSYQYAEPRPTLASGIAKIEYIVNHISRSSSSMIPSSCPTSTIVRSSSSVMTDAWHRSVLFRKRKMTPVRKLV